MRVWIQKLPIKINLIWNPIPSNVDSLVMDCFCGSGGFLRESFLLGRNFIGIDESKEAMKIHQQNLCKCEYGFLKDIWENVRDSKDKYIPK